MTSREKFLATIAFKPGATPPNWEFAYWKDTIERWYTEGLPRKHGTFSSENAQWISGSACPGSDGFTEEKYYGRDVEAFFEFDERVHMVGVDCISMIPPFEEKILSETKENIEKICPDGKRVKIKKDGGSMPCFLDYPVHGRKEFDDIRRRFCAHSAGRYAHGWDAAYRNRTYPLQMGGGNIAGFYSVIREMVGLEKSLYLFYDDPDFATEILDFFLTYYTEIYTEILGKTDVDYLLIWEDLAYKNGPLISPDIFRKFILPYYKELTGRMKKLGVENFFVDTDGNFEALIDLFLEGGITGFYPFEAAANMNVEIIRKRYPKLVLMGGIDKRALADGKAAIHQEMNKVERVLGTGGYIPYTDHMVPPDVSFKNYCYFRKCLKEMIQ
ncbi:uroporphyrinogen decarboxylase family protein [Christensenella tenuis]|uniref:Uroporphyrinogen decarboxylase (URO-D) domain-containing protein n=1 Tax=Christensenella tenuis TaxID=2763033 RepID=A0ABR7EHS9_9FIRM|nr:uroporphyrinogen decarboxylase family protein [Christensenella tenuis]MBC5649350.1 hypothetical protein [Christensenella tenuis]